eukprot:3344126-Rhodomonas_salina.2
MVVLKRCPARTFGFQPAGCIARTCTRTRHTSHASANSTTRHRIPVRSACCASNVSTGERKRRRTATRRGELHEAPFSVQRVSRTPLISQPAYLRHVEPLARGSEGVERVDALERHTLSQYRTSLSTRVAPGIAEHAREQGTRIHSVSTTDRAQRNQRHDSSGSTGSEHHRGVLSLVFGDVETRPVELDLPASSSPGAWLHSASAGHRIERTVSVSIHLSRALPRAQANSTPRNR